MAARITGVSIAVAGNSNGIGINWGAELGAAYSRWGLTGKELACGGGESGGKEEGEESEELHFGCWCWCS